MSSVASFVTFGLEWRLNNAALADTCPLLMTNFSSSLGPWLFCTRSSLPVDMDAFDEMGMGIKTVCPGSVLSQLEAIEKAPQSTWGSAGRIDYALSIDTDQAP